MFRDARITGIASGGCTADHRIAASGEGLVAHGVPILSPLPHIAGHVEQAVTVSWK
jgi:hypothetical protein